MAKLSARYAAIAQPVERILGKDEVASSNLASSSINRPTPFGVGLFICADRFENLNATVRGTVAGRVGPRPHIYFCTFPCKNANKFGERGDRRRWRIKGAERVAAVGKKRVSFVMRSFCRAPQQDSSSETLKSIGFKGFIFFNPNLSCGRVSHSIAYQKAKEKSSYHESNCSTIGLVNTF